MNQLAKSFTLTACALAASVLITACGGGEAGDSTPPTATVTAAASETQGDTTFTFVFSESIGSSFSIEDLVVTGGTPRNFTKVDSVTFTVDVTPTGDVAPALTLPAGKVFDLANNANAVAITSADGSASGDCGSTAPTCAPGTEIPEGSVIIYSDAVTRDGFDARPNWGQTVALDVVTIADNESLKYTFQDGGFGTVGAYEGLTWETNAADVSGKSKLHLDLWSADLTSLKISLIGGGETAVTKELTAGSWNGIDIDLADFVGVDTTQAIQLKIESATGGAVYVDNIYFWGTASGGESGGGNTPNPNAAAGSAGAVALPLLTASYLGDFGAAGDGVFAGDYIGGIDNNGNHATWGTATTAGLASNGNIGYFQDQALSTSSQKLEENGWVGGLVDNPTGVPSFFRYVILNAPATTFADSYMGLYANGPNNGSVDVSGFGAIKFRLWGPAEMYQQSNFNPVIEMKLAGPKVDGCTATGSGGTEIKKTFTADQKIGAASTYKLSLAGWTVVGTCPGYDSAGSVLANLAQVVVTVPGSSFNFTNLNSDGTTYATGVNLGPIIFTAN